MSGANNTGNKTDLVCFNLGGKKFYCIRENFLKLPTTRLGLLVRTGLAYKYSILYIFYIIFLYSNDKVQCQDEIEILKLCDRYLAAEIPEFFFNRFFSVSRLEQD